MKTVYSMLLIAFCFACKQVKQSALPYFNTTDFTPEWIDETAGGKTFHTIPAFSFTDQEGNTITEKDVDHKIYVADFFFTQCTGICPKMTTNMQKVAAAFGSDTDVVILSHSVTSQQDSVPVLKKYAKTKNIQIQNWHLLTGDKEAIYSIARNGYFVDKRTGYDKDTTEFLHSENFVLVDGHRHIRGIYNGTIELEVEQLIKHIRLLKEEERAK